MIYYPNNLLVSELCPVQFAEPYEKEIYYMQKEYCPKIVSFGFDFQVLISEFLYNLAGGLNLLISDKDENVISTTPFILKNLSGSIYYATINVVESMFGGVSNDLVTYKIADSDGNVLAKSVWYIVKPTVIYDIKKIQYSNSENDWNTIFVDDINSYNFWVDVECGFIPKDDRDEQETEDFLEQDLVNETVYGNEYQVTPLTIGDGMGIPNWLRKKISRATLCDDFHIDGIEYKRTNGSKMEKIEDSENGLATYKIDLQTPSNYLQQEFTPINTMPGVHSFEFNETYN